MLDPNRGGIRSSLSTYAVPHKALHMTESPSPRWAGPLAGVRVLDFSRVLAGPAASLALADLGAEIIKIEPPGNGDDTRTFPPFSDDHSVYFLGVNRGKKSIVIDLKSPQGVALARDLAAKCDILIENYRPGVMDRLGLGYDTLSVLNPRLIYCAISGFGMTGPLRDYPSFDIVTQAMSGAMSVNGERDRAPTRMGLPMGDLVGGINGPIGILAALYERTLTGRGRLIDVSLLDGLMGLLAYLPQIAWHSGENPKPQGNPHPNLVPYGVFPARGGLMVIACLTNDFWARLCRALDLDSFINDPRYATLEMRRKNRVEVDDLIGSKTGLHSFAELDVILTTHQVPHAPILGVLDALAQPQAVAREMVVETEHKALGKIPIVNRPIKFPGAPQPIPTAPPVLGEHTDEILRDLLGLDDTAIADLRASQTVA
jgi:crotonobetainyl-CoA:carnitine CoA-transferase CaiB-like acyl-CoA transferase